MSGYSIARDLHNFACDSRWKNCIRVSQLYEHPRVFLWNLNHRLSFPMTNKSAVRIIAMRVNLCSGLDIVIRAGYISHNSRLCNRDYKTACHLL